MTKVRACHAYSESQFQGYLSNEEIVASHEANKSFYGCVNHEDTDRDWFREQFAKFPDQITSIDIFNPNLPDGFINCLTDLTGRVKYFKYKPDASISQDKYTHCCASVYDSQLTHFVKKNPELRYLEVHQTSVNTTEDDFSSLIAPLKKLQTLRLPHSVHITDQNLRHLVDNHPELHTIDLSAYETVSEEGLEYLFSKCDRFKEIILDCPLAKLSPIAAMHLMKHGKKIKKLELCAKMDPKVKRAIEKHFSKQTEVDLMSCKSENRSLVKMIKKWQKNNTHHQEYIKRITTPKPVDVARG